MRKHPILSIKIKDLHTKVIKEKNGSYAIACSALGVYAVGGTKGEVKRNFREGLELHSSVLKKHAIDVVA
jgi:hypothetical protein